MANPTILLITTHNYEGVSIEAVLINDQSYSKEQVDEMMSICLNKAAEGITLEDTDFPDALLFDLIEDSINYLKDLYGFRGAEGKELISVSFKDYLGHRFDKEGNSVVIASNFRVWSRNHLNEENSKKLAEIYMLKQKELDDKREKEHEAIEKEPREKMEEFELKLKKVEHYEVDYSDLQKLIKNTYNIDFSVAESLEASNDSYHVETVDGKLTEDEEEDLNEFKNGNKCTCGMLYIIMNDLSRKGKIPNGEYLISVSW